MGNLDNNDLKEVYNILDHEVYICANCGCRVEGVHAEVTEDGDVKCPCCVPEEGGDDTP